MPIEVETLSTVHEVAQDQACSVRIAVEKERGCLIKFRE